MVYVASVVCPECGHSFIVVLREFVPPAAWFRVECPSDTVPFRFQAVSALVGDVPLTHPLTRLAMALPKDLADNCLAEGAASPE